MFSTRMYTICSNYLNKYYCKIALNLHNKYSYKSTNLPICTIRYQDVSNRNNNLFLRKPNVTLQKALLSLPPSKPSSGNTSASKSTKSCEPKSSSDKPASKTPISTCEPKTPSKDKPTKPVCDARLTIVSKQECGPKTPSKDKPTKPVCDAKPTLVSKQECEPKTPSKDKPTKPVYDAKSTTFSKHECGPKASSQDKPTKPVCDAKPTLVSKQECGSKTPSKDKPTKPVYDAKPTTVSKQECEPKVSSKDKPSPSKLVCNPKPTTVSKTQSKDKTPYETKNSKSSQPSAKLLCEAKPPQAVKCPPSPNPPTKAIASLTTKPPAKIKQLAMPPCEPKCVSGTTPPSDSSPGGPSSTRIVRQEPGKVRLGFIPDEWFMLFYKKTGVTGMGTFCFTTMIFLMSKEYYVLEHEYYGGLSMIILCVLAVKYIGPEFARFIDNEIDEYEKTWTSTRNDQKKVVTDAIENEKKLQLSMEGQLMLVEAKRENVQLQLEAAYRERLMHAYKETKKRLDYCATVEIVERAFARRTMSQWVVDQVKSSVDRDIEKIAINKCLEDLKDLAKTFEDLKGPYKSEDDSDKSK